MEIGDGLITGSLSVSGDLTAAGSQTADLKKTAAARCKSVPKRRPRKFSVLSKIFSC